MMEYWVLSGIAQRAESKEFLHHALCSMRSAYFHSMCGAKTSGLENLFNFPALAGYKFRDV
jgi:hypothetical protein